MLEDFIKVQRTIDIIKKEVLPCNWEKDIEELLKDENSYVIANLAIGILLNKKSSESDFEKGRLTKAYWAVIKSLGKEKSKRWKTVYPFIRKRFKEENEKTAMELIEKYDCSELASVFKDYETFYFFYKRLTDDRIYGSLMTFIADNLVVLSSLNKIADGYMIGSSGNKGIGKIDNYMMDFICKLNDDGFSLGEYNTWFKDRLRDRIKVYKEYVDKISEEYADKIPVPLFAKAI